MNMKKYEKNVTFGNSFIFIIFAYNSKLFGFLLNANKRCNCFFNFLNNSIFSFFYFFIFFFANFLDNFLSLTSHKCSK